MATNIFVAADSQASAVNPAERSVWLDSNGYYWHLYRYFEGAKVNRTEQLVDLYSDAEIEGYELDRLEDELRAAREDALQRADTWRVLTGWNHSPARHNEIWQLVKKEELITLIDRMLWLTEFAKEMKLKLICLGD